MTTKSEAYWLGYRAQEARSAAKDKTRAAMDANPYNLQEVAREVARGLKRDAVRKNRIFQRSPHVFAAMDAEELGQASAREMAVRELKELGIDCGDDDPVKMLDMHHAGRQFARDYQIPGNRLTGGNNTPMSGNKLLGDHSMDSSGSSTLDKYLGIEE
jgi:hypothetical protein